MKIHLDLRLRATIGLVVLGTILAIPAAANWVGGIEFSHPSPGYLPHGEYVTVSIDCKVDQPDGARLYAVPYTNGSPTSGYSYSLDTVPTGTSTATCHFTINSGEVMVDHVKISMRSADNSTGILEFYVRVRYDFGPYGIYNIQLSENDHSVLAKGNHLTVTCDYGSPGPDNVLVFARPYSGGSLATGYGAGGGDLGPADGSASQHFTFGSADADIDQIRIYIKNAANTEVLFEMFHDVDLAWRDVGITNIVLSKPSPSMVHRDDQVDISFDYENLTGEDVKIFFLPFKDGYFAVHGQFEGSLPIPPGSGSLTRFIGAADATHVNEARFRVRGDASTTSYVDRYVPVDYDFGHHVVTNITLSPRAPALLEFGEDLHIDFDYWTDHGDTIGISARPYSDGALNPSYGASGWVPLTSPTGSDNETFRLFSHASDAEVDEVLFKIFTPDYDYLEYYFLEVKHLWGGSGWVSPVPTVVPGLPAVLGQSFPNPFNPVAMIPVTLTGPQQVRLAVYDLRGRLVRVLADEMMGAGRHEVPFDGRGLASGQYFYRLEGAGPAQTRSMMLVK